MMERSRMALMSFSECFLADPIFDTLKIVLLNFRIGLSSSFQIQDKGRGSKAVKGGMME